MFGNYHVGYSYDGPASGKTKSSTDISTCNIPLTNFSWTRSVCSELHTCTSRVHPCLIVQQNKIIDLTHLPKLHGCLSNVTLTVRGVFWVISSGIYIYLNFFYWCEFCIYLIISYLGVLFYFNHLPIQSVGWCVSQCCHTANCSCSVNILLYPASSWLSAPPPPPIGSRGRGGGTAVLQKTFENATGACLVWASCHTQ